jgi:hypothetical protein
VLLEGEVAVEGDVEVEVDPCRVDEDVLPELLLLGVDGLVVVGSEGLAEVLEGVDELGVCAASVSGTAAAIDVMRSLRS